MRIFVVAILLLFYNSVVCSEFAGHTATEAALCGRFAPGMAKGKAGRCRHHRRYRPGVLQRHLSSGGRKT
jgi:hypothetical protein